MSRKSINERGPKGMDSQDDWVSRVEESICIPFSLEDVELPEDWEMPRDNPDGLILMVGLDKVFDAEVGEDGYALPVVGHSPQSFTLVSKLALTPRVFVDTSSEPLEVGVSGSSACLRVASEGLLPFDLGESSKLKVSLSRVGSI